MHNTGNILNNIIPVLYQSRVTCMHEFNYAVVLRTLLYLRYQQLDYIQGTRRGRMTYCYYQGKPIVIPLHACYWYCYILLGR
jgi:hypothetical protein